ncbi:hypothetical protein [Sphingosinicella sp. LY1275]|uniref:hypothetical protein n=1 Tax=Sphingosinicella sp. LY1275 TaxID=3095379 RepID=UPI002ADEAB6C|nr:hypothetical protein [Sphingosinicella sp. LY1275]MEA1015314.1 hypothetical protein [Sphingosinicella sp. LY1275]
MGRERSGTTDSHEKANVAAVWPASVLVAPLPLLDIEQPFHGGHSDATSPARGASLGLGMAILASYAALVAALALATCAARFAAGFIS